MYQASWMHSSKLWRWIWAEKHISNKDIYKTPVFLVVSCCFFSGGGVIFPSRNSVKIRFRENEVDSRLEEQVGYWAQGKKLQNLGSFTSCFTANGQRNIQQPSPPAKKHLKINTIARCSKSKQWCLDNDFAFRMTFFCGYLCFGECFSALTWLMLLFVSFLIGLFGVVRVLSGLWGVSWSESFSHDHGRGNWPYLKGNCYTSMFSLPCLREAAEGFVLLGGLVFMPSCLAGLMNIVHQRLVSFLLTWTFPKIPSSLKSEYLCP